MRPIDKITISIYRQDMPRPAVQDNNRMSLRIRTADKAKIMRASAITNSGMTDFIVRTAVEAADRLIEKQDRITLSERDFARALELLENPPPLTDRARRAIVALPPL